MRGSFRSGAALALTASFIAAACSGPAPVTEEWDPDGEITTRLRATPALLDPLRLSSTYDIRHTAMVFEPLMTLDPSTLRPSPAAAKDQPRISDDGLTYTFTLRDGLKYSDGSALAAKDFAYALARFCAPGRPGGPLAQLVAGCLALRRLDPISASPMEVTAARAGLGLRARGDRELVITLTEPAPYFSLIMGGYPAYPVRESDVSRAGDLYGREVATYIGNGPFKLVEWKPDDRLVYERNEHYRAPARLKRWTKVVVSDEIAFAAYRNNEIDSFGGVPTERAGSVGAYRSIIANDPHLSKELHSGPASFTDLYLLNPSRAPFTDRNIRQAFAKANDRVERFGRTAALSFIPPALPGHDPEDTFQAFDPTRAKELLRSSAQETYLKDIAITYPTADPQGKQIAEWLQQQVKQNLALEIRLEEVEGQTLDQMLKDPRTAPHIFFRRALNNPPDPFFWLSTQFHSGGGFARLIGYKNAEFDALVRSADREGDPVRRTDLYRRASRILSEDAVAIWQWWGPNEYLRKPWVRGVTDSAADIEYGFLRLNEIFVTRKR